MKGHRAPRVISAQQETVAPPDVKVGLAQQGSLDQQDHQDHLEQQDTPELAGHLDPMATRAPVAKREAWATREALVQPAHRVLLETRGQ